MILSAVPNFPIAASFEMDNILYVTRLSLSYRWVLPNFKEKKLYLVIWRENKKENFLECIWLDGEEGK